jgi:hypothetical protein
LAGSMIADRYLTSALYAAGQAQRRLSRVDLRRFVTERPLSFDRYGSRPKGLYDGRGVEERPYPIEFCGGPIQQRVQLLGNKVELRRTLFPNQTVTEQLVGRFAESVPVESHSFGLEGLVGHCDGSYQAVSDVIVGADDVDTARIALRALDVLSQIADLKNVSYDLVASRMRVFRRGSRLCRRAAKPPEVSTCCQDRG